MQTKYFSLFLLTLIVSNTSMYSQKISIYLSEYNYNFTPQKEICNDTLTKEMEDGRTLKIIISDCKGKMHVVCFKNARKTEEGNYMNSLDLLKKYIKRVDGITGKGRIKVYEFYQPLRTGTWFFYNAGGKIIRKEVYAEGILLK